MSSAEIQTNEVKCRGVGTFEPSPKQKELFEKIALALPETPDHRALAERFDVDEDVVRAAISWAESLSR